MTDRVWQHVDGDWIDIAGEVVTLTGGTLSRLDPSASLVWRLLDQPVRESDLAAAIARATGAALKDVAADLATLLEELSRLGLVTRSGR